MTPHLIIDLEAIAANWRMLVRQHGAPAAAVVKADAYGLGAAFVAPRLLEEGARHFFVAQLSEAVALRPLLPGAMIGVLNGFAAGEAGLYTALDLVPVLGVLGEIDAYRAHAAHLGRALPALLHIDTGMSRLGLSGAELDIVTADPSRLAGIDWHYAMTHLVSAECPGDAINAAQLARFEAACARLPPMKRSLANSSGIFLGAGYRSDRAAWRGAVWREPDTGAREPHAHHGAADRAGAAGARYRRRRGRGLQCVLRDNPPDAGGDSGARLRGRLSPRRLARRAGGF